MTKLTLSMDEAVVEKAKRLAEANNTSVSAMFSQFVNSMAASEANASKMGPLTKKLSGVIKLPENKEYKDLLAEALAEKHGAGQ